MDFNDITQMAMYDQDTGGTEKLFPRALSSDSARSGTPSIEAPADPYRTATPKDQIFAEAGLPTGIGETQTQTPSPLEYTVRTPVLVDRNNAIGARARSSGLKYTGAIVAALGSIMLIGVGLVTMQGNKKTKETGLFDVKTNQGPDTNQTRRNFYLVGMFTVILGALLLITVPTAFIM